MFRFFEFLLEFLYQIDLKTLNQELLLRTNLIQCLKCVQYRESRDFKFIKFNFLQKKHRLRKKCQQNVSLF